MSAAPGTALSAVARERGIRYFLIAYTDLFGVLRAKLVPASAIDGIGTRIREIDGLATSIASAVEEQEAATQEIAHNVVQVARGTSEVTDNFASVARASEDTGAAASQVLASASELSRQSEHLAAEVGRFVARVRAA